MTRQAGFTEKIRARMEKTGERYGAARQALLRDGPAPATSLTTVPGYAFATGLEADHALLASALAQSGVTDPATGTAFTETRLFGLSGGIGFMAFLFDYQGHPPLLTFVCRSWSMPGPVVARALDHAGVKHGRSETGSAKLARQVLDEALDRGVAVHITVDHASLPATGVPEQWVGGMPRQANVVGRQADGYVVDLGAPALLDAATLARVRAAAKKEKHRAFTFAAGRATTDPVEATLAAVRYTARNLVEAPVANFASNFGLAALEKQARLCRDPKDKRGWRRVFDSGPRACLALYRTWECVTLELTAPAGGRALYADFLDQASRLPGLQLLAEAADLARESAELFERLAADAVAAAPEVAEAVAVTEEIDELRRSGTATVGEAAALGEQVRALRAARDAVAERCELDAEARGAVFDQIGVAFAAIHAVEGRLHSVLDRVQTR